MWERFPIYGTLYSRTRHLSSRNNLVLLSQERPTAQIRLVCEHFVVDKYNQRLFNNIDNNAVVSVSVKQDRRWV
jgi:hypothetical protein